MFLNPWKRIRDLERQLADAEAECRYLDRLANEAMGRACEYFEHQHRAMNAQNAALRQHLFDIANLTPSTLYTVVPKP